ncbi:MAG: aspartyl protease family protein [Verrucomicrobiota bacterium]
MLQVPILRSLCLGGLSLVNFIADARAEILWEAPLELRNGLVWIKAGVGDEKSLRFLLDTGAGSSFVDLGSTKDLGVKLVSPEIVDGVNSSSQAWRTSPIDLKIGPATMRKSLLAMDLRPISRGLRRQVEGVLGADFFQGRILQIDLKKKRLRALASPPPTAGAVVLPLKFVNDAPCVPGTVGNQSTGWLRLDTGCVDFLQWVETGTKISKAANASFGFSNASMPYRREDLFLGSLALRGVRTGIHHRELFPQEIGLIGNGLFSRHVLTIDCPSKQVVLLPQSR